MKEEDEDLMAFIVGKHSLYGLTSAVSKVRLIAYKSTRSLIILNIYIANEQFRNPSFVKLLLMLKLKELFNI